MIMMEAWTVKSVGETSDYHRVSMHEHVTLYISKYRRKKDKRHFTNYRFYKTGHLKRADVFMALTGATDWWTEEDGGATVVQIPYGK